MNLDHAATTPVRREVLEAMLPFFTQQYGNPSAGYAAGRQARRAVDAAREQTAQALGAQAREIYFTSGGSESDNWALLGVMRAAGDRRHVVTTAIEHHAVLSACQTLAQMGYEITYLPVDAQGRVRVQEAANAIRSDTALVSVMLANNEVGTLQPVAELAQLAHAHGALMHTDAVQAVGHIPVDVRALDVDLLSLSAHKFYGPKGVGALYIREGTPILSLIGGGAQERSLRAGTENTPGIVGLGMAITDAQRALPTSMAHVGALRDLLEREICALLPDARVNGCRENRLPGHLHLSFSGVQTSMLLMRLDMAGIAASAASACAAGAIERSHVLRAMGCTRTDEADLRLTIGEDNTQDEMRRAAQAIAKILKR